MSNENETVSELNVRIAGDESSLDRALNNGIQGLDRFATSVKERGERVAGVFTGIANRAKEGFSTLTRILSPLTGALNKTAEGLTDVGRAGDAGAKGTERAVVSMGRLTREYRAGKISLEEYATGLRKVADTAEAGSNRQLSALAKLRRAENEMAANAERNARRERAAQETQSRGREARANLMETAGRGATVAVTAPIAATLVAAGRAAIGYDAAMRNVNSIGHLTEVQFQQLSRQLVGISKDPDIRQGPIDLAKALYEVYSSGFEGAKALDIVRVAAKGSSAGMTDTATSGRILMAVLNSQIPGVTSAAQAMDVLFGVVERGVVTFPQLATSLGPVLPVAAKAKISLQEVGAAVALMTKQGQSGDESITSLTNLITHIAQPSHEAEKQFRALGISYGYVGLQSKGLIGVLEEIEQKTHGNADALAKLIPEQRGTRGLLALLKNDLKDYRTEIDFAAQAHNGLGKTTAALNEQNKSFESELVRLKKDFEVLAVEAGPALIRMFRDGVRAGKPLLDLIKGLAEAFIRLTPGQQQAALGLLGIAAAIGPVMVGGAKLAKTLMEMERAFAAVRAAEVAVTTASTPATAAIAGVGTAAGTAGTEALGASRSVGLLGQAMKGLGALALAGAIVFTIQFVWEGLGGDPSEGPIGRIKETIDYIQSMRRQAAQAADIDSDPRNAAIQAQQKARGGMDTVKGFLNEGHPSNYLPTREVRGLLDQYSIKPTTDLSGQTDWRQAVVDLQKRLQGDYQGYGKQVQGLNDQARRTQVADAAGIPVNALRAVRVAPGVQLPDKRAAGMVAAVSKYGAFGGDYYTLSAAGKDAKGNQTLTFQGETEKAAQQVAAYLKSRKGADGQTITATGRTISIVLPPVPAAKAGGTGGGHGGPVQPGASTGKEKGAPSFLAHVPLKDLKDLTGGDLDTRPTDASTYQEKASQLDARFAERRLRAQEEAKAGGKAFDDYSHQANLLAQRMLLADNAIRNTSGAIDTLTPKIASDEAAYRGANQALNAQIDLINGKKRAGQKLSTEDNATYARLREQNRATLDRYNADKQGLEQNQRVHKEAVNNRSRDMEALAHLEEEQMQRSRERNLRKLQEELAGGKITRAEYEKQLRDGMKRIGQESPDYARYQDALAESENRRTLMTADLRKKTLRTDGKDYDALRQELEEELAQLRSAGVDDKQVTEYGDKRRTQIGRDEFSTGFQQKDDEHKAAMAEGRESLQEYKTFLLQMLADARATMGETSAEAAKLTIAISHVDWQVAGEQATRFRESLDNGDVSLREYITQMERLRETVPTIAPEYRRMTSEIDQANRRIVADARRTADEVGNRFGEAFVRIVRKAQAFGQAIKQAFNEAIDAALREIVKRAISKLVFKFLIQDNGDKMKEASKLQDKASVKMLAGALLMKAAADRMVDAAGKAAAGGGGGGGTAPTGGGSTASQLGGLGLQAAGAGMFGASAAAAVPYVAIGLAALSMFGAFGGGSQRPDYESRMGQSAYSQIGQGDHTGLIDSGFSGLDGLRRAQSQYDAAGGRTAYGQTTNQIAAGAIVIHAAPGQNASEIADEVFRRINDQAAVQNSLRGDF